MSVSDLNALSDDLLAQAHGQASGRSSTTVRGHADRLRETVIALVAGQELSDHESPGEATIQVLRGQVRITVPDRASEMALRAGQLADVPGVRHGLTADTDAVVLLTVAL
ncbi:cupin domain-containing protein [Gordonia caeni]|uniref:Cupin domain-containing protein n=1 Tax=Gordonia caeni TaxID=1007097 RepID=A0ABP7NS13_9ACTN